METKVIESGRFQVRFDEESVVLMVEPRFHGKLKPVVKCKPMKGETPASSALDIVRSMIDSLLQIAEELEEESENPTFQRI